VLEVGFLVPTFANFLDAVEVLRTWEKANCTEEQQAAVHKQSVASDQLSVDELAIIESINLPPDLEERVNRAIKMIEFLNKRTLLPITPIFERELRRIRDGYIGAFV